MAPGANWMRVGSGSGGETAGAVTDSMGTTVAVAGIGVAAGGVGVAVGGVGVAVSGTGVAPSVGSVDAPPHPVNSSTASVKPIICDKSFLVIIIPPSSKRVNRRNSNRNIRLPIFDHLAGQSILY
jgi:hypothetical protein